MSQLFKDTFTFDHRRTAPSKVVVPQASCIGRLIISRLWAENWLITPQGRGLSLPDEQISSQNIQRLDVNVSSPKLRYCLVSNFLHTFYSVSHISSSSVGCIMRIYGLQHIL